MPLNRADSSRRGMGKLVSPLQDPDTWTWNEELQRFYYPPSLGDPVLQEMAPGILPSAKSLQFGWEDLTGQSFIWGFPSQGEGYRTCGEFRTIGCLRHTPGYGKRIRHNCGRASCPICYRTWILKSTQAIVDRLEAGRPPIRSKPIHITVSIPQNEHNTFATKKGYLKMRRKSQVIAKKAGFLGGCCIFHPYRENKAKKLWRWSPHFHMMGYGWIRGTDIIHANTGWIVKNHRVRKSIGGTAYYQLSHAGIKEGHHVITWFGILSWKALKVPRSKPEPETCPTCGAQLYPIIWIGIGDNPLLDPEAEDEASLNLDEWAYWHR